MAWGYGTTTADAQSYGVERDVGDKRSFYLDDPTHPHLGHYEKEASQAALATIKALSPKATGNIADDLTFFPVRDRLPQSALDQVWKTAEGLEMMPIAHGTTESIQPEVGWSPKHAVHRSGPSGSPVRNQGWYAHASHDPEVLRNFSSGGLYGQHHGDIPLSEYRKGFQYAPIYREPEIRLSADNFNKAFQMGQYANDPLARKQAKTIRSPNRLGRLVPVVGAGLAGADAATRFGKSDFLGAGLGIMSGVPGPIGWGGLGLQVAYDIIRSGIKSGVFKTQQDIDTALNIMGPPGIRGDY